MKLPVAFCVVRDTQLVYHYMYSLFGYCMLGTDPVQITNTTAVYCHNFMRIFTDELFGPIEDVYRDYVGLCLFDFPCQNIEQACPYRPYVDTQRLAEQCPCGTTSYHCSGESGLCFHGNICLLRVQ